MPCSPTKLLSWAVSRGAQLSDAVTIGTSLLGHGLFARKDLDVGAQLLLVPQQLLLTPGRSDTVRSNDMSTIRRLSLSKEHSLALQLAAAASSPSDSEWEPYVACLPDANTPTVWSEDELADLQISPILDFARDRLARLELLHKELRKSLGRSGTRVPSAAVWVWANAMVSSRAFVLQRDSSAPTLVPIADLMNTALPPHTHANVRYAVDLRHVRFETQRAVRSGDELLISYWSNGSSSSAVAALDYGIALSSEQLDPDLDQVLITTTGRLLWQHWQRARGSADQGSRRAVERLVRLEQLGGLDLPITLAAGGDPPNVAPFDRELPTVSCGLSSRLLLAATELVHVGSPASSARVDSQSEAHGALMLIRSYVDALLDAGYSTTLAEDEAILKSLYAEDSAESLVTRMASSSAIGAKRHKLSRAAGSRYHVALAVRVSEKRLLHRLRTNLTRALTTGQAKSTSTKSTPKKRGRVNKKAKEQRKQSRIQVPIDVEGVRYP